MARSERKPRSPRPTGKNQRKRTLPDPAHPNGTIDRDASVYSTLTDAQKDKIQSIIDGADPNVAAIYLENEGRLKLLDGKHKGSAFYSPAFDGVYLNVKETLDDENGETWFHEFGHQIDYMTKMSPDYSTLEFSARTQGFIDAIEHDVSTFLASSEVREWSMSRVDQIIKTRHENYEAEIELGFRTRNPEDDGRIRRGTVNAVKNSGYIGERERKRLLSMDLEGMTQSEFEDAVRQNIKPNAGTRNVAACNVLRAERTESGGRGMAEVSDIFDGQTKGAVNAGWGHKNAYWADRDNLPIEAYANMSASSMVGGESAVLMQKYFPTAYNEFQKLVSRKRGA